eukprot:352684_1
MADDEKKTEENEEEDDGMASIGDFVQIYMISLDIICAHNLEKADTFGGSDAYCKVSAFATSYTTATILKNLNPSWNEHVELTFFNDPKTLKFEVFDWDKGSKDDAIGDCEFSLDGLYDESNEGFSGKIELKNAKRGEIEIKVTARKMLPLELEANLSRTQDAVESNKNEIENLDNSMNEENNKINTLKED